MGTPPPAVALFTTACCGRSQFKSFAKHPSPQPFSALAIFQIKSQSFAQDWPWTKILLLMPLEQSGSKNCTIVPRLILNPEDSGMDFQENHLLFSGAKLLGPFKTVFFFFSYFKKDPPEKFTKN
jgi:hypothetical protein